MGHPLRHPKGKELLGRVAQAFFASGSYIVRDSNIMFVCGGPMNSDCMRPRFCEYAKENLGQLRVFLAEDAQRDLVTHEEGEFYNIGEFEEFIGSVSACIVLFPESAGSFTELGFFSKNEDIRRKLLVVNDQSLQGQDSFISLGPINMIDRYSQFRPTIQMPFDDDPPFHYIKQRIEKRIPEKRRGRLRKKPYKNVLSAEKLFVLLELINIFQALNLESIIYGMKSVFGNANEKEIRQLLSILIAAKYVQRDGPALEYCKVNPGARSFFDLDSLDLSGFRLEVLDFYQRDFPEWAAVVEGPPT